MQLKTYILLSFKKTTDGPTALSYLDIMITIDNGKYSTTVYDKRDSFNFTIVNFPYLTSNIPSKPAYGVYISQLVRIDRICSSFAHFKERSHIGSSIKDFGIQGYVRLFEILHETMQAYSINTSVVFINTSVKGYVCQPLTVSLVVSSQHVQSHSAWSHNL